MTRERTAVRVACGIASALLISTLPTAAAACQGPSFETPILHRAPPSTPGDVFAAEVEIADEYTYALKTPIRARVLKVLQGSYTDQEIMIAPQILTSCDRFPARGARGVIVGKATRSKEGVLMVDPIRAPPESFADAPATLLVSPLQAGVELQRPK